MVSQQLLNELKEIIKDDYGHDLEMEKVSKIGNGLVDYFDLLAKMYHDSNINEYETSISKNHK